jgi:ubiquinone/menaquinone biosynthesis C-methylase UbiE
MSILFLILKVLGWIALVILGLFIFLETIIRLVKHFIHFPPPPFVVYLLNNPIRRKLLFPTRVVDCLDIREGMRILEVGPGSGFFTFELAKYAGPSGHVFAVDIEPKMTALLEKRIKREKIKNITTKTASAYEIPLPNNSVDLVFMGGVLGEIPDKQKALREMQRVLKEEGFLAVMECLIDPDYPRRKTVTR